MSESTYSGPIKHIVVLMLENRSYDNVLGWLYDASNEPPYDKAPKHQKDLNGLTKGGPYSNPDPSSPGGTLPVANQTTPTQLGDSGPTYPPTTIPIVDPGEFFADMAQQYLGSASLPSDNPYGATTPPDLTMQGFTTNYAEYGGPPPQLPSVPSPNPPPESNVKDVMNYFTPAQLGTTSFLANKYAVCDSWFASAPTQTFTNRAFSICAGPGVAQHSKSYMKDHPDDPEYYGLINDTQYTPLDTYAEYPSLFSVMDSVDPAGGAGPNWKVYFHDYSISTLTVPYVASTGASTANVNLATFDTQDWPSGTPPWCGGTPTTFLDDIAGTNGGVLPPFALIEPRYSNSYVTPPPPLPPLYSAATGLSPNSNHPGGANYALNPTSENPPIDAADGEALLALVYTQLAQSEYWDSTLLIVTYDEGGGIYDHVAPGAATPPGALNVSSAITSPVIKRIPPVYSLLDVDGAEGFDFNMFGGRVPAIVCSPYIAAGTTVSADTPFDHTSIISTAWEIFNLASSGITSLNERDGAAPSLVPSLSPTKVND